MNKTIKIQGRTVQFPWGDVKDLHYYGDYTVVEFYDESQRTVYFAYDHTVPVGLTCKTLEQAIISAIICRYLGGGVMTVMTEAVCRMLKLE